MNPQRDENWISPEVRMLMQRLQRDTTKIEALEALFIGLRPAAELPAPDEDAE
jgi:hypothetical protein